MNELYKEIMSLSDEKNAKFQAKLAPTLAEELFLGTRVPDLRLLEKKWRKSEEITCFLKELPHRYYDENLFHSIALSNCKDYEETIKGVEEFLPFIDNWAVSDTLRPKVFAKNKEKLLPFVKKWIESKEVYTCRVGINLLMTYYLDDDFKEEYLELPSRVISEEYYVNMMVAWYYATALAKQWETSISYLEKDCLGEWVHNKTIQKACESFRITSEQKDYLRSLKRRKV